MPARPSFDVDHMRRDQVRAYHKVRAASEKRKSLKRMLDSATAELSDAIGEAGSKGIPHAAIAEVTGYTEGRIWQLIHAWHPAKARKRK